MNVALVVLDTVRKDAFDKHFDWHPGTWYENAYSTSHWTVPAHASLFSGVYPTEHGAIAKSRPFNYNGEILPEQLRSVGYRTRALSANPNVSKHFDFDRGFDRFYEAKPENGYEFENIFNWDDYSGSDQEGVLHLSRAFSSCLRSKSDTIASLKDGIRIKFGIDFKDESEDKGAESAARKLQSMDFGENEFLFVNLMEAHTPYEVPDQYYHGESPEGLTLTDSVLGKVDTKPRKEAYNACVKYLSDKYKQIFELLSENFDYIFTISDHGHMFGEYGHSGHEFGVYPELTHVPVVLYDGSREKTTNEAPVSLIDIHQSVLDIAEVDSDVGRGESLIQSVEARGPYLTEYNGLYEYIFNMLNEEISEGDLERLDSQLAGIVLENGFYGYETAEGFDEVGEFTGEPHEILEELRDELVSSTSKSETEGLSENVKNRLEEFGYM